MLALYKYMCIEFQKIGKKLYGQMNHLLRLVSNCNKYKFGIKYMKGIFGIA